MWLVCCQDIDFWVFVIKVKHCNQSEIKKSNTVISLHKRSELIWVIVVKNKHINMKADYLKKTAVLF